MKRDTGAIWPKTPTALWANRGAAEHPLQVNGIHVSPFISRDFCYQTEPLNVLRKNLVIALIILVAPSVFSHLLLSSLSDPIQVIILPGAHRLFDYNFSLSLEKAESQYTPRYPITKVKQTKIAPTNLHL